MSNEELADYLHISLEDAIKFRRVAPEKTPVFERMKQFEMDWMLYLAGNGPRPSYALIDEDRE